MNKVHVRRSLVLLFFFLLSLTLPLTACSRREKTAASLPAYYGERGSSLAVEFARSFPDRYAGTATEKAAADWLLTQLKNMGYEAQLQPFSYAGGQSANVVLNVQGRGFKSLPQNEWVHADLPEWQAPAQPEARRVIILAHYDCPRLLGEAETAPSEAGVEGEEAETEPAETESARSALPSGHYDGLHNNAAGVAVLLTSLEHLRDLKQGYQLTFVFCGAGAAGQAGARAFAQNLSQEELQRIDCVYNFDSIYAGDKVYAHAGRNSAVGPGKKSYALRRKLYEATDIYYDNLLLTHNGFALYTNQSQLRGDLLGRGVELDYREWSLRESDQLVFDEMGLPVVYFDSFDYDGERLEDIQAESRDPFFAASGGQIAGTAYDASEILLNHFVARGEEQNQRFGSSETAGETQTAETTGLSAPKDRLIQRINNLSFILLEALKKPPQNCELR